MFMNSSIGKLPPAWYSSSIEEFLAESADAIIGRLALNGDFDLITTQRDAWIFEIEFLKESLLGLSGWVLLEFSIPRMGRRIDAVLLSHKTIFVLEFKVGSTRFHKADIDQVWDYALDLKNFHKASHSRSIVPILISTGATSSLPPVLQDEDGVYRPLTATIHQFREMIALLWNAGEEAPINPDSWANSPYSPTPTIIEAARALYSNHSVDSITRYDAGAKNLLVTSRRIEEIASDAKARRRKAICFVTGVPGAGKTLVGLNIATKRRDDEQVIPAVFLSGNGPLVSVLREALTRDELQRQRQRGVRMRKSQVAESVRGFIQNVHHFRDEALRDLGPPPEHVAVFDEAQRAWNLEQTSKFMARRKGVLNFSTSEPEFLISYMDRHEQWAVIVCLVGGGQEINTGEAGIETWVEAIATKFPDWDVHISPRLTDSEYGAGAPLRRLQARVSAQFDDRLHLAVSMRSFRAENVSTFVKCLLDCDTHGAQSAYSQLADRFPIAITRDLDRAKEWVRTHARGTERFGLVASSRAQRLKPHAIDVRVQINPIHWFLNGRDDTRSSFYLEDAATEYVVQGLELDW